MLKALVNVRIYDYQDYIENGYIVFEDKILEVGEMSKYKNSGYEEIDGHGQLVLPNFVCSHAHIYSIFARGMSLPFNPHNFQEILDQMWWKMDSKIDNEITYYSGICAGAEFLKNGVTTIIDHHASGKEIIGSLEALKEALCDTLSIRSILCFETSDRYNVGECIKENHDYMVKYHNDMTCGLFGLHASMSLSEETLEKVHDALEGHPIHIHVAESEMDPEDCMKKYGMTIIERLDKHQLINKDSLIVHGVYVTDKELDIIKKRGAYVVVNTSSNMNNAVGLPDVMDFIRHGIPVMVGNDGLSSSVSNEYQNVYYTARLFNKSPLAISLSDVLSMINNSYDYASRALNIKLGRLAKGYEADFMLVNYTPFTAMNKDNAFGHVFFGLYPTFTPKDVYRGGQCLVKNGKILNSKVERGLSKALDISSNLWKTLKEE